MHPKLLHCQISVRMSSIVAALEIIILLSLSVMWQRSMESWKEMALFPTHPPHHIVIDNLEKVHEAR